MNSYEISFYDLDAPRDEFPGGKRVVVGTFEAKNGIEAIKVALRARGLDEDLIAQGRSIGSNKRLVLAGISFEANKKGQS